MKILFKNRPITQDEEDFATHWDHKEESRLVAVPQEDHIRLDLNSSIPPHGLDYLGFVVPLATNMWAAFDQSGQVAIVATLQEGLDACAHQLISGGYGDAVGDYNDNQ